MKVNVIPSSYLLMQTVKTLYQQLPKIIKPILKLLAHHSSLFPPTAIKIKPIKTELNAPKRPITKYSSFNSPLTKGWTMRKRSKPTPKFINPFPTSSKAFPYLIIKHYNKRK